MSVQSFEENQTDTRPQADRRCKSYHFETYPTGSDITQMRITAAVPGRVNFELPIEKQHTNRLGILHGATLATIVDTSGSLALASRGLYSTGVSTDINVTYLNSGGKVGDLLRGEVVCDKCGLP
jgi:acyl-coenzyme A thioesterase 13